MRYVQLFMACLLTDSILTCFMQASANRRSTLRGRTSSSALSNKPTKGVCCWVLDRSLEAVMRPRRIEELGALRHIAGQGNVLEINILRLVF